VKRIQVMADVSLNLNLDNQINERQVISPKEFEGLRVFGRVVRAAT
jgi:hypothetical protein